MKGMSHAGWVEFDAELVRVVEVLRAHRMRVKVEAAQFDTQTRTAAMRTSASSAEVPRA